MPLKRGKKNVSRNIRELRKGPQFAKTQRKFGKKKLQIELTAAMEERAKKSGTYSEDDLRAISRLPERVAKGKQVFVTAACATCHTAEATGNIGPNLRDDFWIHGPKFSDNLKVIWNGVPDKGMVSWKGVLQPRDIHAVASYIHTLRGTKPPNPKPPENQAPAPTGPSEFE